MFWLCGHVMFAFSEMALGSKPHTASKTECLAVCTGILDNQICFHFIKGWDIFLAWAGTSPKREMAGRKGLIFSTSGMSSVSYPCGYIIKD